MESKDFVTEQILSLEDFDNVEPALMEKISSNEEYRKLFEECRELSEIIAQSAPEPVKDGVTLHDAVMKRINDGDVAPRYIKTGRYGLPIATAASIAVIVSATLMTGTGIFQKEMADNEAQRYEVTDTESNGVAETNEISTTISVFPPVPKMENDEKTAVYSKKAEGSSEDYDLSPASVYDDVIQGVYSYSSDVADAASEEEEASCSVTERQQTSDYDIVDWSFENWSRDDSGITMVEDIDTEEPTTARNDAVKEAEIRSPIKNDATEKAVTEEAVSADTAMGAVTEAPEAEAEAKEEEAETYAEGLDLDVVGRMVYAAKLVPGERLIAYRQISELGTDNYIAWFDGIKSSEDFADIYSIESFTEFCKNTQTE